MLKLIRIALVAVLFHASIAVAGEVKVMTNTWPPYVDEQLPEEGVAVELVKHILHRAGYQMDNTIETWPRAMEGVRIGLYDALGAAWRDEAREHDFIYSKPYLLNELVVVKRSAMEGRYFGLGSLQGGRIGLLREYAYGVDFSELDNVELVYENHLIQSLMNLLNEKVDFVVGDKRVLAMMMQEYLPRRKDEIEYLPFSLPPRGLYLAASRSKPGSEQLVKSFNAALEEVKRDGSFQKIVEKWQARYGL
jgi:polar amino acid transport system substrate-binding protein